jgi:hypothetical protein
MRIFEKDSNICSNHITGKQHYISTPNEPATSFFQLGIAAANTSHVQYFDGVDRREKHDEFS